MLILNDAETTRAVFNMVAHDVLVRYPDLKIVVPHCGSFLPNALPRFKGLLPVVAGARNMGVTDKELMALPHCWKTKSDLMRHSGFALRYMLFLETESVVSAL